MQKQATQLLALLAAILIIWFVAPMIAVNNHPLLPNNTDRLFAICGITVIWLIVLLFKSPQKESNSDKESAPKGSLTSLFQTNLVKALAQLKNMFVRSFQYFSTKPDKEPLPKSEGIYAEANLILTKHFQTLREYLRTHAENKKKPAYLIIGHKGSGKTSLLKHSGLKLKTIPAVEENSETLSYFEHEINVENNEDIKNTLWHLEQQCIFIDTPGDYAASEIDGKIQTPWRTLLSLLVRKHQKHPLKGIILTINLHELLSNSPQNTRLQLHLLKQRVQDVKKLYGEKLPLYLVFTQWDAVTGFSEFFDNLSTSESKESFAIHFHKDFISQSVTSQFQAQYEILLQQMNRMLITRMHHEHNDKKRALISQFPLQMEQMQKYFFHVVQQLLGKMSDRGSATPTAVFFTSSELSSQHVDIIQEKLKTSFNLPCTQLPYLRNQYSKSHFIEGLFKKLVQNNEPEPTKLQINAYVKYAIYGTASVIILAFASFCLFKLTASVSNVNQITKSTYALNLLQDKVQNPKASAEATKILAKQIDKTSAFWMGQSITQYSTAPLATVAENTATNSSLVTAQTTDAAHILTKIKSAVSAKPELNAQLQNYLEQHLTAAHAQPAALYSNLKAYLMLANPKHIQTNWLYNWLQKNVISSNLISNNVATLIIKALQQQHSIVKTNQHIIEQARNQLVTLPKQYLAFLILQDQAQYSNAKPLNIQFIGNKYSIPFLFTAKGLQTLFLNNLQSAINTANNTNWILGPVSSAEPVKAIQTQVVQLYISNYVSWWSHVLSNFQVPKFTNLKALADYTSELSSPNAGLIHNLYTISNNINAALILPNSVNNPEISSIRSALQKQAKAKFENIANIDLSNLQAALMQYNQMLYNLTQSANNRAAFETIKNLFINPKQSNALTGFITFVNKQPQPIQTELLNLAKQSMPMIQKAAGNYVEMAWQTQVLSFFNNNLQNTYPLYPKAAKDSSIENFTKFFAPGGILDNFYRNNLALFIDASEASWTLKSSDGLTLPLSPQLLRTLEKGRIISAMFFPHNSNTMKVQFTLQQIALMPIVKSFALNINGQSLNDQQGSRNVSTFIWPGNNDASDTSMRFDDINGQHVFSQQKGPWAWFHLLGQSFIHSNNNSQSYVVTFDVDGNEARYHLNASAPINPFIPGVIGSFRLPQRILM